MRNHLRGISHPGWLAGILLCGCAALYAPSSHAAAGASDAPERWQVLNVAATNWTPRFVTNRVDIHVMTNVFVDEYRTNRVVRTVTNTVDVHVTNRVTKTLTNVVPVNLVRTNFVETYQTNVTDLHRTNWVTRLVTNIVTVDLARTNFVEAFQTNLAIVTLTNWQNVLITRTNWVTRAVTNVVETTLPAEPGGPPSSVRSAPAPAPASTPPAGKDVLVLEAARTGQSQDRTQVQLKVRLQNDPGAAVQVQQWRVEREDGAVVLFGQGPEFKSHLPTGRYRVDVTAKRGADAPALALHSVVDVTRDAVVRR
jgi:hypothetical protein